MLLLCALMAGGSSAWAIDVTATLTGEAMLEGNPPSDKYSAHTGVTDDKGNVYKGYWVYQKNGQKFLNMIQIKKHATEKSAHIVLPKFDGYIKTITLTTTDATATTSSGTGAKTVLRIVKGTEHTSTEGTNVNNKILDEGSTSKASKSYVFDFTELGTKYDGEGLYIASLNAAVRIWKIEVVYEVTTTPAKITAAEYATFNSKYATDFSTTDITVYTAVDNGLSVGLNEVTSGKVPANTPVVLYKAGADGTPIDVPVIPSADVIEQTNNLAVSDGSAKDDIYVLAQHDGKVGFYKWAGAALSAGKVYLKPTAPATARDFLGFDETTAVESVKVAAAQQGDYYNLAGQRVANPTKGLYIVNGKKVIIK